MIIHAFPISRFFDGWEYFLQDIIYQFLDVFSLGMGDNLLNKNVGLAESGLFYPKIIVK